MFLHRNSLPRFELQKLVSVGYEFGRLSFSSHCQFQEPKLWISFSSYQFASQTNENYPYANKVVFQDLKVKITLNPKIENKSSLPQQGGVIYSCWGGVPWWLNSWWSLSHMWLKRSMQQKKILPMGTLVDKYLACNLALFCSLNPTCTSNPSNLQMGPVFFAGECP